MLRRTFLSIAFAAIAGLTFAQAPEYYPPSIGDYDGASDYLERTGDLIGNANSKLGIFSAWLRIDGGDGNVRIAQASSADVIVQLTTGNVFQIFLRDVSNGTVLDLRSTSSYTASSAWLHLLASWDVGSGVSHLYVNGASDANEVTNTDAIIDYTQAQASIGAFPSGTTPWNGAIAEMYFNMAEYVDLSVESNRRKFIDANGYPVDLGPSGYKPTGTAPLVYMRTQFNNAGLNSGTGGDFTINGAPSYTTGPVHFQTSTYDVQPAAGQVAVDYNGSTDYLSRGSDLTGNADNKTATISFWFFADSAAGSTNQIYNNSGNDFQAKRHTDGRLFFYARDTVGGLVLTAYSDTVYEGSASWHHCAFSIDASTGAIHLYVDDVDDLKTGYILNDLDIDFTQTAHSIASSSVAGANWWNGKLSELYFTNEYLDLSVESNRRKFIDANGYPVDLGPSGYKPTGTAPLIYMRTQFNNAGLNSGTGGDFVINGAPAYTVGPVPVIPSLRAGSKSKARGRGRGGRSH